MFRHVLLRQLGMALPLGWVLVVVWILRVFCTSVVCGCVSVVCVLLLVV